MMPERRPTTSLRFRLLRSVVFTMLFNSNRRTASIVQFTSNSVSTVSDIFPTENHPGVLRNELLFTDPADADVTEIVANLMP